MHVLFQLSQRQKSRLLTLSGRGSAPEGSDAETNTEAEPATLVATILGGASGLRCGLGAILCYRSLPPPGPVVVASPQVDGRQDLGLEAAKRTAVRGQGDCQAPVLFVRSPGKFCNPFLEFLREPLQQGRCCHREKGCGLPGLSPGTRSLFLANNPVFFLSVGGGEPCGLLFGKMGVSALRNW